MDIAGELCLKKGRKNQSKGVDIMNVLHNYHSWKQTDQQSRILPTKIFAQYLYILITVIGLACLSSSVLAEAEEPLYMVQIKDINKGKVTLLDKAHKLIQTAAVESFYAELKKEAKNLKQHTHTNTVITECEPTDKYSNLQWLCGMDKEYWPMLEEWEWIIITRKQHTNTKTVTTDNYGEYEQLSRKMCVLWFCHIIKYWGAEKTYKANINKQILLNHTNENAVGFEVILEGKTELNHDWISINGEPYSGVMDNKHFKIAGKTIKVLFTSNASVEDKGVKVTVTPIIEHPLDTGIKKLITDFKELEKLDLSNDDNFKKLLLLLNDFDVLVKTQAPDKKTKDTLLELTKRLPKSLNRYVAVKFVNNAAGFVATLNPQQAEYLKVHNGNTVRAYPLQGYGKFEITKDAILSTYLRFIAAKQNPTFNTQRILAAMMFLDKNNTQPLELGINKITVNYNSKLGNIEAFYASNKHLLTISKYKDPNQPPSLQLAVNDKNYTDLSADSLSSACTDYTLDCVRAWDVLLELDKMLLELETEASNQHKDKSLSSAEVTLHGPRVGSAALPGRLLELGKYTSIFTAIKTAISDAFLVSTSAVAYATNAVALEQGAVLAEKIAELLFHHKNYNSDDIKPLNYKDYETLHSDSPIYDLIRSLVPPSIKVEYNEDGTIQELKIDDYTYRKYENNGIDTYDCTDYCPPAFSDIYPSVLALTSTETGYYYSPIENELYKPQNTDTLFYYQKVGGNTDQLFLSAVIDKQTLNSHIWHYNNGKLLTYEKYISASSLDFYWNDEKPIKSSINKITSQKKSVKKFIGYQYLNVAGKDRIERLIFNDSSWGLSNYVKDAVKTIFNGENASSMTAYIPYSGINTATLDNKIPSVLQEYFTDIDMSGLIYKSELESDLGVNLGINFATLFNNEVGYKLKTHVCGGEDSNFKQCLVVNSPNNFVDETFHSVEKALHYSGINDRSIFVVPSEYVNPWEYKGYTVVGFKIQDNGLSHVSDNGLMDFLVLDNKGSEKFVPYYVSSHNYITRIVIDRPLEKNGGDGQDASITPGTTYYFENYAQQLKGIAKLALLNTQNPLQEDELIDWDNITDENGNTLAKEVVANEYRNQVSALIGYSYNDSNGGSIDPNKIDEEMKWIEEAPVHKLQERLTKVDGNNSSGVTPPPTPGTSCGSDDEEWMLVPDIYSNTIENALLSLPYMYKLAKTHAVNDTNTEDNTWIEDAAEPAEYHRDGERIFDDHRHGRNLENSLSSRDILEELLNGLKKLQTEIDNVDYIQTNIKKALKESQICYTWECLTKPEKSAGQEGKDGTKSESLGDNNAIFDLAEKIGHISQLARNYQELYKNEPSNITTLYKKWDNIRVDLERTSKAQKELIALYKKNITSNNDSDGLNVLQKDLKQLNTMVSLANKVRGIALTDTQGLFFRFGSLILQLTQLVEGIEGNPKNTQRFSRFFLQYKVPTDADKGLWPTQFSREAKARLSLGIDSTYHLVCASKLNPPRMNEEGNEAENPQRNLYGYRDRDGLLHILAFDKPLELTSVANNFGGPWNGSPINNIKYWGKLRVRFYFDNLIKGKSELRLRILDKWIPVEARQSFTAAGMRRTFGMKIPPEINFGNLKGAFHSQLYAEIVRSQSYDLSSTAFTQSNIIKNPSLLANLAADGIGLTAYILAYNATRGTLAEWPGSFNAIPIDLTGKSITASFIVLNALTGLVQSLDYNRHAGKPHIVPFNDPRSSLTIAASIRLGSEMANREINISDPIEQSNIVRRAVQDPIKWQREFLFGDHALNYLRNLSIGNGWDEAND